MYVHVCTIGRHPGIHIVHANMTCENDLVCIHVRTCMAYIASFPGPHFIRLHEGKADYSFTDLFSYSATE